MDQGEPSAKVRKPNEESDRNENAGAVVVAAAAAAAAAPIVEQVADILKLDIDCFEEAFDYSRLKDLLSVGKTCKRLQQVAGYCFNQNYGGIMIRSTPNGFKIYRKDVDATHFAAFIRKIRIDSPDGLRYFLQNQSKLRRLKYIRMHSVVITQSDIDRMTETLSKVEDLRLYYCNLNFHGIFAHCKKLQCLRVKRCVNNFDWLAHRCSTLEHFEFIPKHGETEPIKEILTTLEQNQNIRKLAITANVLWTNRDLITNVAGIKLDTLAISFQPDLEVAAFCHLLAELHARGLFNRLDFYNFTNQNVIDQLATVNGTVTKLFMRYFNVPVTLSTFHNLEELFIPPTRPQIMLKGVTINLINLKRIHIFKVNIDDIMLFIQRAVELNKIKVNYLENGIHFNENTKIIDLPALNREREQLPDAAKITFYVQEKVYLATKWAVKETNFQFIRLKRLESFSWKHDFS